ncbi:hypothetical protein EPA93_31760 [Ktedonosporobacter rubrisoli]|uniref:DUF3761 domain-containing protein n=1 Tax=Ktedonosporobacter rubrisoli TaxID=2509675 RepID=A0A4P6JXN4_KTERU|nr:hypothetical protein [Ktedonosporobacter rubrisoli]QBD80305.1 hypothetical protein EPA93_31760 [Ktedonosporobacter rubrisoli]
MQQPPNPNQPSQPWSNQPWDDQTQAQIPYQGAGQYPPYQQPFYGSQQSPTYISPGQFANTPPPPPPPHIGPGQPQPYSRPYGGLILATLILVYVAAWIIGFAGMSGITTSLILGLIVSLLIIDWRGFTSLQDLIKWKQMRGSKRFWLGLLFICTFYIMLGIYLCRACIPTQPATVAYKPRSRGRSAVGLVVGTVLTMFFMLIAASNPSAAKTSAGQTVVQGTVQIQSSPTATRQKSAVITPTTSISVSPTAVPTIVATSVPASTPTIEPTQVPTVVPTQPPMPTPTVAPTQPPAHTGVNGNPWGYDFNSSGNKISDPPAEFCNYFSCIKSFWNGTGYVIECQDNTFSKSGGNQGSCSHHGGDKATLFSH